MFTHRISKIVAVLFILAVMFVTASFVAGPAHRPTTTIHADPRYVVLEKQNIREYELGERFGQLPATLVQFSAKQTHREYVLGERYGTTAQSSYLHEYWLGERYGQRP